MRASHLLLAAAISAVAATSVMAQPAIVSLGTGAPSSVTRPISGVYYVGGSGASGTQAARWAFNGTSLSVIQAGGSGGGYISKDNGQYIATGFLNGPTRFAVGNTATGVVPAFLSSPTLVASTTQPAATEFGGGRWDASTGTITGMGAVPVIPFTPNPTPTIDIGTSGVYGSSSGGSTTGNFITPNAISANGRYIVALAYVCVYNTAGTSISANSFYWRPVIWDAQGNGGAGKLDVLPTPFRTSTSTGANTRRRTGNPYAVSNDGQVIVGATEHNVGATPGPDVDGGRLVVWRWNSSTNSYGMTYLDTGVDTNGFPKYISSTPSGVTMNTTGTIIAARGPDGITKWVWDGTSWGAPIVIGANLSTPATWLPAAVTGCGVPPSIGGSIVMSDDGNIIAGSAVYSTCGSFMSGGFIWHNADGQIKDWYDYLKSLGTPGVDSGMIYGPIGDNGDPSRGLPALGFPTAISPDGNAVTSIQSGTQRIIGAVPTLVVLSGGSSCLPPSIALEPNTTNLFSACTSSIILNTSAAGSGPFTYQWYKDGNPLSDGLTPSGATIVGATSFQFRLNAPIGASDAGNYSCVVTGQCGTPAQTINASVAVDPAFPAALNDVCSTATTVNAGTNVLSPAQSPCAAYIYDSTASYSCGTAPPKNDLWYVFTPATSGNYRFDTCGANFDTHLGLFADCNGNELACNNDYLVGPSTGCTSNRSRIGSYTLAAGVPVYIRVAANSSAFLSATSTLNLSITTAPAAATNDLCDNAATAVIGANALDTTEANGEFTASCAASVGNTRDVWFKYTPASDGLLTAATCPGTTWNTVLGIYTDCFGSEIACNDNTGLSGCSSQSSIADLQVTAGTTYFFRVGGNSLSAFGAGSLTLSFIPQGACCTGNICSVTTAALCATSGGTYKGNGVACGDQTCTSQCALADFNHMGGVTADDIFAFLDAWFAQNGQTGSGLSADVNASNSVTADDIFAFLDLWFTYNGQTCP